MSIDATARELDSPLGTKTFEPNLRSCHVQQLARMLAAVRFLSGGNLILARRRELTPRFAGRGARNGGYGSSQPGNH